MALAAFNGPDSVVHAPPAWKVELAARMLSAGGKFEDGTANGIFKDIAEKHKSVKWQSVSTSYYQFRKQMPREVAEAIQKLDLPEAQPKEDDTPEAPTPPEAPQERQEETKAPAQTSQPTGEYKRGETVEARVEEIRSYGAFVETTDGFRMPGLIHISEIMDSFVSDVNKFFHVGQIVRAKVKRMDEKLQRLELSTKGIPLKEHGVQGLGLGVNNLGEVVSEEKRKALEKVAADSAAAAPKPAAPRAPTAAAPVVPAIAPINETEMAQIRTYLNAIIGELTPEAEKAFVDLITKNGMFAFSMMLLNVAPTFKADIGLVLAGQIAEKLSGGRA